MTDQQPVTGPDKRRAAIRKFLRQLREGDDHDMTQSDLGVKLGISQDAVSRIESGGRGIDLVEAIDWLLAVHNGDREAAKKALEKIYDHASQPRPGRARLRRGTQGRDAG